MKVRSWRSLKQQLAQRDRWRVEDILKEQPDLLAKDPRRDMELWRHLFAPDDLCGWEMYSGQPAKPRLRNGARGIPGTGGRWKRLRRYACRPRFSFGAPPAKSR